MSYFDRRNTVRVLAAYAFHAVFRRVLVALIPVMLVIGWLLFTIPPADLAALVDWRVLARVIVLVGRVVVSAPVRLTSL